MPWDPANFTVNFSFTKQSKNDPTTEYENTNDYRGSLAYSYSPFIKPFKPFGKVKGKGKNARFLRDWELQWLPNNISFLTTMSRYYYEQQTRSEADVMFQLPVSVSKNWLWDRQLSLSWNITKASNCRLTLILRLESRKLLALSTKSFSPTSTAIGKTLYGRASSQWVRRGATTRPLPARTKRHSRASPSSTSSPAT